MPITQSGAEAYISRLRSDFPFFVSELWHDRGLDTRAPLSDIELDMADFAANGPRRRGILAFRGIGKTHVVTATLSCFRGFRDPDRKIIIVSKSGNEAKKTVSLIRQWLDAVWFLRFLAPARNNRDAATYLDFGPSREDRQPSITALGVGGQLEGNRAHSIFPDDVETKGNTLTPDARAQLAYFCGEYKNILYPDRPHDQGGPIDPVEICYVMTPKHEETIAQTKINEGYTFRAYPIAYPKPSEKVISLAPIIAERLASNTVKPGDPTVPLRFGPHEIVDRQAEGYLDYAREFMLIADLAQANRHPLRLSDLIVMDVPRDQAPVSIMWGTQDHNGSTALDIPAIGLGEDRLYRPARIDQQWAPYNSTKAGLDPAGRGSDKTGLAIVGHLNGNLFAKAVLGLPGGADDDSLNTIAAALREHDAREVWLEDNIDIFNTYKSALDLALRRHFLNPGDDSRFPHGWKCAINTEHAGGQKELRIIETLEPVTSTHRLIVDRRALIPSPADELKDHLQYQLSRLTKDRDCLREDGKIDALAKAVAAWRHTLKTDPATAAMRHRERQEAQADAYFNSLRPKKPNAPRW